MALSGDVEAKEVEELKKAKVGGRVKTMLKLYFLTGPDSIADLLPFALGQRCGPPFSILYTRETLPLTASHRPK